MAKKRANGEGSLRKRSDDRWEGRYTAGHNPETGKAIYKNVLAKTHQECNARFDFAALKIAKMPDGIKCPNWPFGFGLRHFDADQNQNIKLSF